MYKYRHYLILGLLAVLFLYEADQLLAQSGNVGRDRKTFAQRRQEWLSDLPNPTSSIGWFDRRNYVFGWLEKGIYNDVVAETIDHIMGEWWMDGIRAQHGYAVMMLRKYGSDGTGVLSDADEELIKRKMEDLIVNSRVFSDLNPNKQIYAMVGVYLYTKFYESGLEFPIYGHPDDLSPVPDYFANHWDNFSYQGRSYRFGDGPYDANQLAKDWLENVIDTWFVGIRSFSGNRELDTIDYHRAYPGAMALLWSQLGDSDRLKTKAKMVCDLLLLDAVMDIGNTNSWGGTMGRTDYKLSDRNPIFPTFIYWGMAEDVSRFSIQSLYSVGYEPPPLVVDLGVLTDEPNDYWHFNKEYNGHSLLNHPDFGKWTFITKYYSIGSNVGQPNSGWQVVVKGRGKENFIRFWINGDATEPSKTKETNFLGLNGRQFRNAIFADVGSTPYYWERRSGTDWDMEDNEDGWRFKKLDRTMVAIRLGSESASVELALEGVDYGSWSDFKSAVKNNASLVDDSYATSTGARIAADDYCGLYSPGDCQFPFKRLEVINHRGNNVIRWNNNVMTLALHGNTMVYNFNNWTVSEDYQDPVPGSPSAPKGVDVQADGS